MSIKLMSEYLILKSINKAKSNYDNFNLFSFENMLMQLKDKKQKLTNAQLSSLNFYLFDNDNGIMLDIPTIKKELKTLRL